MFICSAPERIRELLSRKRQLNEVRTWGHRQHKASSIITVTHKRLLKELDKEIESINKLLAEAVSEVTE